MQESLTKNSSLPPNYVSINDLRDKWLMKQRPEHEAKAEEEEEKEDEKFPRKYVTINDLREKWLKKQQKKEKDEENLGENPNLIEDNNRGLIVSDSTLNKAEIDTMTGAIRKKTKQEKREIWLKEKKAQNRARRMGIVEKEGEKRGVVAENDAEMKQIGVSVMHIAVTQETENFRKKKRFSGRRKVVNQEYQKRDQEVEEKEKLFLVTGMRNTVQEKRAQEVEEKARQSGTWKKKRFPVTRTRNIVYQEKHKQFPVTRTQNTVQEKRALEVKEKLFLVQEERAQEVEEKPKQSETLKKQRFPVTGNRNMVHRAYEEKEKLFLVTEAQNTVQEKRAQEVEENPKRSETGEKKRFPVTGTRNMVLQRAYEEEEEEEKLYREMEEKMKEVSELEKRYQEVEQEMKEKMKEVSLLEKRFQELEKMKEGSLLENRFQEVEKMKENHATESENNLSSNVEHGTCDRRAMGYRKWEVSGRGGRGWRRGGGRSGNGNHSNKRGLVWVKKDD